MNLDQIIIEDSYLLGWNLIEKKLIIFAELLLRPDHILFSGFDKKTEHGCYKFVAILVDQIISLNGLDEESSELDWNDNLGEYKDIAEIEQLVIKEGRYLFIKAENFKIEAEARDVKLLFDLS
jgi:hypothetical protein